MTASERIVFCSSNFAPQAEQLSILMQKEQPSWNDVRFDEIILEIGDSTYCVQFSQ